ncbi:uncharacterized protein PB18E9.04c-like [Trichoplusia ni]|uniref:Uncharacterized protein PB18E9.04c-like n=1 Tax=Trichoplusia ni TaxID=7111 RepID=A0A7E5W9K4_TRINI|nr:uncharacterized protein PB18E9.04c-like [Trichoplusia ni]
MLVNKDNVLRTIRTESWCAVVVCAVLAALVMETAALNGDNVCMVKQKYNITKRVKYRAPMSVRTYEWCFSMPPRCSKWNTEMRDLTRLETEERIAEVAVCCPGYKMMDVSCVPICPNGKTGPGCSEDCPDNKWGPNCIHECKRCKKGFCSPLTGECECLDGWQGESCDASMPPTTATTSLEELLTVFSTKTTTLNTTPRVETPRTTLATPITTVHIPSTRATTRSTPVTTPKTTVTQSVTTATTSAPTVTTSTAKITTVPITSPPSTSPFLTTTLSSTTQVLTTQTEKKTEVTPLITSTEVPKKIDVKDNITLFITSTEKVFPTTSATTQKIELTSIENRTETTETPPTTESIIVIKTVPTVNVQQKPLEIITTTEKTKTTIPPTTLKETTIKLEQTKKETTIRILPTTVKFKPKEIWIRPAQKGESPIVETKIKTTHEFPKYRSAINNNKELTPVITTPKTIIVSIIPTSVSYSTFKKIALTSSYMSTKSNSSVISDNRTEHEFTKPMVVVTSTPLAKLSTLSKKDLISTKYFTKSSHLASTSVTPKEPSTKLVTLVTKSSEVTKTISHINRTNSMMTDINQNVSSTSSPITSSYTIRTTLKQKDSPTNLTTRHFKSSSTAQSSTERTTKHFVKHVTHKKVIVAPVTKHIITTNTPKTVETEFKKANVSNNNQIKAITDGPMDDEEFHILTEPEHITAVMGEKGTERSSVDLISVISIAGGVMMAVITVAVIIVMIERCKKPRYDDVRKINDIRMQVMIDNNDVPPPYVRSIFHTPLPDPPNLEKCHYQPISTLDRNLKQFMRPVVVQTISPIMLENFRGILECHYDHLPRRSHDFETIRTRSSIAPSMNDCGELRHLRTSMTESAIEAMKCEAKLDVIDNTTSEPLYAEIPCWRPPSEHAIEIMNLNGEAITEL